MTIEDVKRLFAPLQRRIMLMVARSIINLAKDGTAQISVLEGEVRDNVDRMQEWGFASIPEDGADAVVVFVGGNRDHGVVVASGDKRYRPELAKGETAIWTKDVLIKIDKDKNVKVTGAETIQLNGDSKRFVTWDELNTALQSHTHSAGTLVSPPGTAGGPVSGATGSPVALDISPAKTTTIKTGG